LFWIWLVLSVFLVIAAAWTKLPLGVLKVMFPRIPVMDCGYCRKSNWSK
jgi:hypothetical protein